MPPTPSRRSVLLAAAAATVPLALPPASPARAAEADPHDALRQVWRDLVLGTGFTPTAEPYAAKLAALGATARDLRSTMAPAGGSLWPDLPYADPEPDTDAESYTYSGNLGTSYHRLRTMTEAYAQPGTGLTGDTALRAEILAGLDHLHDQAYHASRARYGNWYHWQIGIPQALLDIDVLLHDHLGAARIADHCAAVDHFVPDSAVAAYTGTSTGANRVDLCRVLALRGVVGKSSAKLALARDALSPVFPYVTKGDGLHPDGSFIQHLYVPYAGSYGAVMLGGLSLLFALLKDSPWEVTDPGRQVVADSVEKAYAPFLFNGLAMDAVSGRAVSRGVQKADTRGIRQDDHLRGHAVIACVALLARSASTAERARWDGMVKGWIARDHHSPVLTSPALGVAQLARLKAVADGTSTASPEPTGHRLFPAMDRAVHRRPTWAAALSMASNRITYYENGNGENLRAWHSGSGMLYWWGDTYANGQYSDGFWPTVDPRRLPGTTASRKVLADGEGGAWGVARPDVRWVGGATDGTYAAVGQYLKGLSSTLLAKKSWFFLDDAVVCLGAGIHGRDGTGVESVVENRNLGAAGTHALTVDGSAQPVTPGWSATLTGVRWAHLAGHAGYVFPGGAPSGLKALREARTGAWSDINRGATADPVTRRYLTLWFDHGTDPTWATYAYVLMPGASAARTSERPADTGWLTVLANTNDQQGVRVPSLGFTGVSFWFGGTVGAVTASAPASVMIRESGGTATVCVSGPLRDGAAVDLTWNRPVAAVTSHDPSVQVIATGRALELRITPGTLGAVHKAVVRLT
ncbi:lyase [Streptomyces sp. WAC05374]|uniref:polysaccharide lyase 8 family protein n=1 Tax=Streptomyces sp. WAC05374 TaxID=2487420 RepID=UPI000F86A266|nr:polysaccharide lyase 8 family protein [Streptomyces sp. WAC05374]RST04209.1 lyase [Streptomyces sp. WAC05374]TDF40192.1 lyase [Streptomyces sp. WAC05374]TDF53382.1 lyase [Streptomyces sp. WAC05374]TDF59230.1 lyase [Streptomyces sp. WAC05374]